MNDDGSGQKNLTNNPANDGAGGFLSETEIVFFSDRTGDCEIYRMDLKTGEVSRITNSPGYDGLADVWVPPSQLVQVRFRQNPDRRSQRKVMRESQLVNGFCWFWRCWGFFTSVHLCFATSRGLFQSLEMWSLCCTCCIP